MSIIVKQVSKFSNRTDRYGEVFEEFTAGRCCDSMGQQHMLQSNGGQVRGLAEWTRTLPPTMVGYEPT